MAGQAQFWISGPSPVGFLDLLPTSRWGFHTKPTKENTPIASFPTLGGARTKKQKTTKPPIARLHCSPFDVADEFK